MKRVFVIVLDSVGAGALPDANKFGDEGANTLLSVSHSEKFNIPNLRTLGIGNIEGLSFLGKESNPRGAYGRLEEKSFGKDTTTGHWEIAGLVLDSPFPTYPNGFPKEIIDEFSTACKRGVLCNKPYSGTEVIRDYGDEHVKSGKLIVYTSADSVFQIAAHEDVVPPQTLYEYCKIARKILSGKHGVGRVIARPFTGDSGSYVRTANRRDFSLEPVGKTMLDAILQQGRDVIAVGKITDIFAGKGISKSVLSHGNAECMAETLKLAEHDFDGLCFVNLVDFDMVFGHRNNVDGYAEALSEFDVWLPLFLEKMGEDDVLFITADHGCDPGDTSTDHTREYVPLLVFGKGILPVDLKKRSSFSDIAATVCDLLCVPFECAGISFAEKLVKGK